MRFPVPHRLGSPVGLVAAALVLAGCSQSPGSAPAPTVTVTASATGSESASPSFLPRSQYTPEYAAQIFDIYMRAVGQKDVATICGLNVSVAPDNPDRQSAADCFRNFEEDIRIESDYWRPDQLPKWAGMKAVPATAALNDQDNYVFDSAKGGFTYSAGKPAECAAADGCWFVLVYDAGAVYVSKGQNPVRYS